VLRLRKFSTTSFASDGGTNRLAKKVLGWNAKPPRWAKIALKRSLVLPSFRKNSRWPGLVKAKEGHGILVDAARFRHKIGPDIHDWRIKNISTRYSAASVRRFAFLLPADVRPTDDERIRRQRNLFDPRIQQRRLGCRDVTGTKGVRLTREQRSQTRPKCYLTLT
jgi:hypothetical protein